MFFQKTLDFYIVSSSLFNHYYNFNKIRLYRQVHCRKKQQNILYFHIKIPICVKQMGILIKDC